MAYAQPFCSSSRDDLVDQLSGTIGLAGATVNRLIETDFSDPADLETARSELAVWETNHAALEETL